MNFIVYAERKNIISRSIPLKIVLGAYALIIGGLFDIWLIFNIFYLYIALIVDGVFALIVLFSKRDRNYKIFWILLILILPASGCLVYLLSNRGLYFLNYKLRCKKFDKMRGRAVDNRAASADGVEFLQSQGFNLQSCEKLEYFSNSAAFFEEVITKLKEAEEYIYIEFFIFDEGRLAEIIFDILSKKAKAGVAVYIIYDELGAYECIQSKRFKKAQSAGVRLRAFNPVNPLLNLNTNYRDHRKIIVIDGKVAYTGGINIADEYIDTARNFGVWKDCGVKVEGGLNDFIYLFEKNWYALTKEYLNGKCSEGEQNGNLIAFGDGVEYGQNISEELYLKLICGAKERISIMTPYFMPGGKIIKALSNAAARGVEVNLYLPHIPDKVYVHLVSRLNAAKCVKRGINVKLMSAGFLHSKVLLCDNIAAVCTANFDYRSLNMQAECGILCDERQFVSEIEEDFLSLEEVGIAVNDDSPIFKNKFEIFAATCYDLISYLF